MKQQLVFLLARPQTPIEWLRTPSDNPDEEIDIEDEFPEDLRDCLSNTRKSAHFRDFGKELGVLWQGAWRHRPQEPRGRVQDAPREHPYVNYTYLPYIAYICLGPNTLANVDSARDNLAGTFVNAFVNAGFGNDKLMVEAEEGNGWVYKNKEHG